MVDREMGNKYMILFFRLDILVVKGKGVYVILWNEKGDKNIFLNLYL